ncbi:hypothetical protein CTA1_6671 [Colletotrichum tanaceti]|uniref:Uncharacterized protein n=1 Tax=Colletotrichum tanaceti TaxID=1306861 RepID=A0A4U6WZK1_9PEZI|nr:hypothetical protein CTA1_6671 [Colletotrichum tanaceti]
MPGGPLRSVTPAPPPVRSTVSSLRCILCVARDEYCQQMPEGTSRCRAAAFEAGENTTFSHSQEKGRGRQFQCLGGGGGGFLSISFVGSDRAVRIVPPVPAPNAGKIRPLTVRTPRLCFLQLTDWDGECGGVAWRGYLLFWSGLPRAAGLGVGDWGGGRGA